MLRAQKLILDTIDADKATFGIYSAEPQPAITALSDLRAVAARILNHAEREDLQALPPDLLVAYDDALSLPNGHNRAKLGEKRTGFMAPARAAVAAVGVTAAIRILDSDTIRDAGKALRWFLRVSRQRGAEINPSTVGTWGKGTSARLKAVQISALAPMLKPSDQLRYRANADSPCHRLPMPGASSRHERVPSLLWPEWALRLQPTQVFNLHILRAAFSMLLLLPGTRRGLSEATRLLGKVTKATNGGRLLHDLEAHAHWPQILTAMTRLSDHLDNTVVPIDYSRRRLDYNVVLPEDDWDRICRRTGAFRGTGLRLQLARCLLFEKISGMPADLAPASFAIADSPTRNSYLNFPARLSPELAAGLNAAAEDFLHGQGVLDEPMEWQPPISLLNGLILPGPDLGRVDVNELHRIVHGNNRALSDCAQQLGISLDTVRYLLGKHPAPRHPRTAGHVQFEARMALPRDALIQLYTEQRLSLREIAHRVGTNRQIISRLLADYGIERRASIQCPKIVVDRDWLYEQYINQRRTLPDLAQEAGMSTANMARWAKTHNIPLRDRGGASHDEIRVTLAQASTAPRILRPALNGHGAWERLQRFATAARYPTITAAATALGLHQGPLTIQIHRLERELGGQLLERAERGRPMQLTPFGRKVILAIRKYSSAPAL
ncbi:LysR family transcriptional regulator [Pseudonocardiaceae bacterium YIM PH 21723]|nr:LysR family transcriptional regulator [Pseudonocardiaceae bacterium YIM PH 21723]